jgi:rhodanese-related sulfurtransferase
MDRLLEYVTHHTMLAGAAVLVAALVLVYELRERAHGVAAVSPQEVIRLMNHGALVLDLRPQEQFAAGHIQGAKLLASHEILTAGETLKRHREKPVIVYCDSGSLGAAAVRQLVTQGFTKAFNLRGGLSQWRTENLPLAKS